MANGKHVPEEHLTLCEGCGYILQGLSDDTRCPECGKPIVESTDPSLRQPAAFEQRPGIVSLLTTSLHVLFRPSHFYRHLATRRSSPWSTVFCVIWLAVTCLLFAAAGFGHAQWLETRGGIGFMPPSWAIYVYGFLKVFAIPALFVMLFVVIRVAARLTAWEAAYRGLRLPLKVVQRGLDYHSVHLLPVGLVAAITVQSYMYLLNARLLARMQDTAYLWVLCAEVIICAGYLFFTYWAAMRNMLFASR